MSICPHRHLDGFSILHPKLLENILRALCLGDEIVILELLHLKSEEELELPHHGHLKFPSFPEVSYIRFLTRQQGANAICVTMYSFSIFSHWVFGSFNEACVGRGIHLRGVLSNPSKGYVGKYRLCS
jgi:hypothetical protein